MLHRRQKHRAIERRGWMMDSGTSVPTRPTRIIFQETGFRDKEIPGSENSTSKAQGLVVLHSWTLTEAQIPGLRHLESDSQVAGVLECKHFCSLSHTEVHLARSLPQGRRSHLQSPTGDTFQNGWRHRGGFHPVQSSAQLLCPHPSISRH